MGKHAKEENEVVFDPARAERVHEAGKKIGDAFNKIREAQAALETLNALRDRAELALEQSQVSIAAAQEKSMKAYYEGRRSVLMDLLNVLRESQPDV